jgi:hypothetical protein
MSRGSASAATMEVEPPDMRYQALPGNEYNHLGLLYTIADIGLFAYTHVAGEGGVDLTIVAAIQSWINRGKNQPLYIKIYYTSRTLPSPFSVV